MPAGRPSRAIAERLGAALADGPPRTEVDRTGTARALVRYELRA